MGRIFVIIVLCIATGCGHKALNTYFKNHGFDKQVIEKLPIYDSLANILLENYSSIHSHIKKEDNYYRYIPSRDGNDIYKLLPKPGAEKVEQYIAQIGTNHIYGFEVFKDTTMKILISDTYIQADHLYVRERLSFYPLGGNIRQRDFPIKDTILNRNWQYWISFDEEGPF